MGISEGAENRLIFQTGFWSWVSIMGIERNSIEWPEFAGEGAAAGGGCWIGSGWGGGFGKL